MFSLLVVMCLLSSASAFICCASDKWEGDMYVEFSGNMGGGYSTSYTVRNKNILCYVVCIISKVHMYTSFNYNGMDECDEPVFYIDTTNDVHTICNTYMPFGDCNRGFLVVLIQHVGEFVTRRDQSRLFYINPKKDKHY